MIDVGDIAPDFILTDNMGISRSLLDTAAEQYVVLVFYRGDWCPYCQLQMRELGKSMAQFDEKGGVLWGISPQKHEINQAFAEKREIPFPIVWDEGQQVISEWGLIHELDPHQSEIPYPTTYIIGAGNQVVWRHIADDHIGNRPQTSEILAALPARS